MSTINFWDYTGMYNSSSVNSNDIFSSMGMTSGNSSISDLALIKSGTYKKLVQSYYTKQEQTSAKAETDAKLLTLAKSSADNLKKASDALSDGSLWEKNDEDEILKAVKSFIEAYNDTVDTADDVDSNAVLRNAMHMTSAVSVNGGLLADIGIKIGNDNKLELDEETFKNANMSTVKTLLSGSGSLADTISQKASGIVNAVSNATGTYTKSASYSNTVSLSVSNMLDTEV
ncbi:MAG: flagellar filament capping protein FliD [Wujia sp.]